MMIWFGNKLLACIISHHCMLFITRLFCIKAVYYRPFFSRAVLNRGVWNKGVDLIDLKHSSKCCIELNSLK